MEQRLANIEKHIASIDITLAKQAVQLEEHMRRSEANERAVATLHKQLWAIVLATVTIMVTILVHK